MGQGAESGRTECESFLYQVQPITETMRVNREEERNQGLEGHGAGKTLLGRTLLRLSVWVEASPERGRAELSLGDFKHGVGRRLRWGTGQESDAGKQAHSTREHLSERS